VSRQTMGLNFRLDKYKITSIMMCSVKIIIGYFLSKKGTAMEHFMRPKIKFYTFYVFVIIFLFGGANLWGAEWEQPFNGKDLSGWEVRGGTATYKVEDGMIVGSTVKGSPNTFLCTEKWYGDFIMEFEVKVDPVLNSGVQIRSHSYRKDCVVPIWREGKKIDRKHKEGDVYGYQVEISNEKVGTSGGVWDEARKSMWLDNISEDPVKKRALKDNQWNKYRIECVGDRIKTWVNDVPCTDLIASEDLIGFIGLQVHGVPANVEAQVRWRNIRIQNLGRHVWKPLFDGETLAGWHALPGGNWEVKNGIIRGVSPKTEKRHGLLVSDRVYDNFTIRFKYKAVKGNSGFYFRSDEVDSAVGVHGFQAEIDVAKDAGGLYETGGRGWVSQPTPKQVETWFKPQQWNQMTVYAQDRHVVVFVNDRKTAELKDDPGRLSGHLALQLHGNMEMDVCFKDLEILVPADNKGVHIPFNGVDLKNWKLQKGKGKDLWTVGVAEVSPDDPKMLIAKKGIGEMINLAKHHGDSLDIYTNEKYGSCRLELEVMVPKESNSGIYVMGEYEVQVLDSWGVEKLSFADMGAIYGAAPPPINATKKPGEWQKYLIDFLAPVFDEEGNKITNARFIRIVLNDKVLHRELVIPQQTPAGVDGKEKPLGPLKFQGNHGPVAYRNIIITDWSN